MTIAYPIKHHGINIFKYYMLFYQDTSFIFVAKLRYFFYILYNFEMYFNSEFHDNYKNFVLLRLSLKVFKF